ncbi:hypothetical protein RJJ65_36455, partial [Rhizobium hidalgonense]
LLALCGMDHLSSSANSAWNFFCKISSAAASAKAFSLRINSRSSCFLLCLSVRISCALSLFLVELTAQNAVRHYSR